MDSNEELYRRLVVKRGQIHRIDVGWNASYGGPRMDVRLLGRDGQTLDEWNDWMILGQPGHPGSKIIPGIVRNALGDEAVISVEEGSFSLKITIR